MEAQKIIEGLEEYITPKRKETFRKILQYRTRYISVMLENIYQPHNASAILRSCDAFGVQDVHVIEQSNSFHPNEEIAMGSAKWLSIYHREEEKISDSYDALRGQGYKIIATSLKNERNTLDAFEINTPSVLVFGNELHGLSNEAIELADETLYIPMFGFVESFNISVSVAIILSHIITSLHNSSIDWSLNSSDAQIILLEWLRKDIHKSGIIEERLENKGLENN